MKTLTMLTSLLMLSLTTVAHAAPTLDTFTVQAYMKKANDTAVTSGTYNVLIGVRQNSTTLWAKNTTITIADGLFSKDLTGLGDDLSAGGYASSGVQGNWSAVTMNAAMLANAAAGAVTVRVVFTSSIDGATPTFDIPVASVPTAYIAQTAKTVIDGSIGTASLATAAISGTSAGAADAGKLPILDAAGTLDLSFIPTLPASSIGSGTVDSNRLPTAGTGSSGVVTTGAQTISGAKTFDGATTFSATGTGLTVSDDASIGDDLTIGGDAGITGNSTVGGTLGVTGVSSLGVLAVSGTSTFAGASQFGGNVDVVGNIAAAVLAISGTSSFTGASNFGGNLTVGGTLTLPANSVITSGASGTLTVGSSNTTGVTVGDNASTTVTLGGTGLTTLNLGGASTAALATTLGSASNAASSTTIRGGSTGGIIIGSGNTALTSGIVKCSATLTNAANLAVTGCTGIPAGGSGWNCACNINSTQAAGTPTPATATAGTIKPGFSAAGTQTAANVFITWSATITVNASAVASCLCYK